MTAASRSPTVDVADTLERLGQLTDAISTGGGSSFRSRDSTVPNISVSAGSYSAAYFLESTTMTRVCLPSANVG